MANKEHLAQLLQGVHAWNEWRFKHIYREEDPDFRGADLSKAELSGADLFRADLNGADLHGAILSKADLGFANLNGANLETAHLRGANLSNSDLRGTQLHGADLRGAYLGETLIGSTMFGDVDLSTARGLETARHIEPSSIGIDTLYRSHGNIPEVFLRGAGIPEEMIIYMKALVSRPFEFYSCFISYNHTDKSFARRLHDQIQGRGIRCWLDERQMLPGDDIYDQIDRGIRLWDKVLLCCSQASLTSWWVDNEINRHYPK